MHPLDVHPLHERHHRSDHAGAGRPGYPEHAADDRAGGEHDGDRDGGKKGVAHVVVYILADSGKKLPADGGTVTLDNKHCEFTPLISIIPMNANIKIMNSDATNHNTKGMFTPFEGAEYQAFNPNLKSGGTSDFTDKFEGAGVLRLTCDQHYWMEGYAIVADSPYFVMTDAKGNFEIKGLPAGEYKAEMWHEKLGKAKADVTVTADGTAELEVKMGESKGSGGGRRRRGR